MSSMACLILFISSLTLLSVASAQDQGRAPHGIAYESPMAFSPSAVEFFHPKTQNPDTKNPCAETNCSPLPLAAQVEATQAHESKYSTAQTSGRGIGAAGIAGIVFGLAFAVLLAMGVYYVTITRRANMTRATSVQPDA